jgi:excisionase family DNA binding protein
MTDADQSPVQQWLTVDELAEYLKFGRTKIYSMAQRGEIPVSKIGNQWRFNRAEIDEWLKSSMNREYVHGYSQSESKRLTDQAQTLCELLHHDTAYPDGAEVLEAGCGVGAQTCTLAAGSPGASFTCVDIAIDYLGDARRRVEEAGLSNVSFLQGDLNDLPFEDGRFDHVFFCFVLEHLPNPLAVLRRLRRVLKPGGTITAIEGDHDSTLMVPDNADSYRAVECLIELQAKSGGDARIGRKLYPLLVEAGFNTVRVSPRMVYVDASRPELIDGFTEKTFTAMVGGVREDAVREGLMTPEAFDRGIAGLRRTKEPDGVFCYTFFKALGVSQ